MTFSHAVGSALRKYATFSGRALRSEYWWFYLFTVLVGLAAAIVDAGLTYAFGDHSGIVGTIANLALFLPSLAVTARRLHDTGRTGWWMLLPVIPFLATLVMGAMTVIAVAFSSGSHGGPAAAAIGLLVACAVVLLGTLIVLLVFLCQDSKPGPNKYGPSPKEPPLLLPGPGGYYPPSPYGAQPYGNPQQPPAPPVPDSYPTQR